MPFKRLTCLSSSEDEGPKGSTPAQEQMQLVPVDKPPDIPENERGFCTVVLQKSEEVGLGLTVIGGLDKEYKPEISNMRSNGVAATSDCLQTEDHITSVNGIKTSKMKHVEIISLLKNVGETVALEIEYHLPPTCVSTPTIAQRTVEITLTKNDGGFGFVLRGGYNHGDQMKTRSLVVTHIRPGSAADIDGTMKTGDRLKCIGGLRLYEMTLENVYDVIKAIQDTTVFTIEYDVSVMDAVNNASGPLLVEISKAPGGNLGIVLAAALRRRKRVICIDKIILASIADRCGALRVGDQLLSIDNVSLDTDDISVEDANKMLQSNSDHIRIEILPIAQLAIEAPKSLKFHSRHAPSITSARSLSALNFRQHPAFHRLSATTMSHKSTSAWHRPGMHRPKYAASAISLASVDFLSGNQVVRTETLEICLRAANDNCPPGSPAGQTFGIQLQGGIFATEVLTSAPAIAYIESDSAAEKSGRIQVGDRLVSINGCGTESETLDDVNGMLSEAMENGQAFLELEFDIAESVMPSSGTFRVKLPKIMEVDIGIVVGSTASTLEPLVITDVKRGSVAYRNGTIKAGDKLLAIDGVRFDGNSTVEDAIALLLSAEDMVRLKIRKDDDDSDDAGSSGAISFTVVLKRYGGPLGITLTGTEDALDPIIVSGLTPGGIAQRTGAIHAGDQILSINNVPLRAKPLSEAIRLLQSAGDTATLKIRKQAFGEPLAPPNRRQRSGSATFSRNSLMNEPIAELSDPEDDAAMLQVESALGAQPAAAPVFSFSDGGNSAKPEVTDRISPAGAPSFDSAVGSLERTTSDAQSHRSNSGIQVQWTPKPPPSTSASEEQTHSDKTQRRIDSLRAKFESNSSWRGNNWGRRQEPQKLEIQQEENSVPSASGADWQNALDVLQSVGQSSDIARDLEESFANDTDNVLKQRPPFASNPKPCVSRTKAAIHSHPSNPPAQLHKITLQKDSDHEDFGFSLSDGQLERGVFVHSARRNGPADRAGIRPYDRLLQVNGIRTRDFTCYQAIPLIAQAGKRVSLVIARHPQNIGISAPSHQMPRLSPPMNVPPANAMKATAYETV